MAKLIIFSGAGLSAESGIDTFRTTGGAWQKHDPDVICNIKTWQQNYDLVHQFYNDRRVQLATVQPNSAHALCASWQRKYETVLVTQNVDDLLERAGCTKVMHLHGYLPEMCCATCGHTWNVGYTAWQTNQRCPSGCDEGNVKPHVVFFGEEAPYYADLSQIISDLHADDVVVVTGTSEQVIPMGAYLRGRPGFKIFNGLEPSLTGGYDENLLMPATEAFPVIDRIVQLLLP